MNIVLFRKKVEGVRLTKPSDDLNVYNICVLWATIFLQPRRPTVREKSSLRNISVNSSVALSNIAIIDIS